MRAILDPWRQLRRLPRSVWVLAVVTLINRMGTMVVPFLVLYLTQQLRFSPGQAGALFALYGLGALVASPFSGRLCDRFGAARVMALSLGLSSLVMLAYPLVKQLEAVAIATVLLAFTNETFRPASMAILGQLVTPDMRKQAFSLNRLAVNLGMSIGPAVGGFLAGWWFPAIFYADGLTSLAGAVGLALSLKLLKARGPEGPVEPTPHLPLHADRVFLLFLFAVGLVFLVFFQLDAGMPLYMVNILGFSKGDFGLMFTLNTFLIILIEVPLNAATARWPHNRALFLGCLLVGCGFGGLALATTLPAIALTVVVWTCGEMILFPANMAFVADVAPPGREGEYMGYFSAVGSLAFMLGPAVGSVGIEHAGPVQFWAGAFMVALTAGLMMLLLPGQASH